MFDIDLYYSSFSLILLNLYLIMELDKEETHEEILIYDIESENNEPPLHVRDDPEPE